MADDRIIWPAKLHHLCLTSGDVTAMTQWYRDVMGMTPRKLDKNLTWLAGSQRNILLTPGKPNTVQFAAFTVLNNAHLDRLKSHLNTQLVQVDELTSPLFENNCFAFVDPDGNRILLGIANKPVGKPDPLPGCLQHIVFVTTKLSRIVDFYTDKLGFKLSDVVRDEATGDHTACFLRCDKMHHSVAFFRAPEAKLDHFANEASCWNDIRDWGDHFSENGVKIVWGAGRHGAGNNLFIFVRDPDGNNLEISAELEKFTYNQKPRIWAHDHRPLNLWGQAWLRS